ncbi:MAG: virulence RhuM family protein [Tepidisphaeraceae bacterium]
MAESQILLYQTEDKKTQIEVKLEAETVWLSQKQMADLFQTTIPNINLHIKNVYDEGELSKEGTIKDYLIVQTEGGRQINRSVSHYTLDLILSVGYRVKSHIGTKFRIWATQKLREYLIKGFTLDDKRMIEGDSRYFDELLERVRAIRTSERLFYQKVTDIYATSIDHDENAEITRSFFATVQNKFHYAIHNHTASELVVERANAERPNMGLTTWKNAPDGPIRKTDVSIAKNYLNEKELRELNLIVDQYLSFAELQATQKKPMHMQDWVNKLHDFLTLNVGQRIGRKAVREV